MNDTPTPASTSAGTPGKQVIVLVDDDRFLLEMYGNKFMQSGFDVHICQSVKEALAVLRGGVSPTAVLFDIVMPGDDGFSFLKTIQDEKLAPGAKLIALTNQSNDADRAQAEKLGADRYVVKATMIPSEVLSMVQEELQKH